MARRSGRRQGESGTREAIRATAAQQFADRGYDRTSVRSIAAEAGVDPALVSYFFGSKQKLFIDVVGLPFAPAEVVPLVFAGGRDEVGQRLADFALGLLENPVTRRRVLGLVRAAASEPEAARLVRELFERQVVAEVAQELDAADGRYRATLVGSQLMGLVMARYVIGLEPLASAAPADVARALGPTLQRYLTGPLDAAGT